MGNVNFISAFYIVATYTAFAILIIGILWRIIVYAKTPMCVKIPLTPAPTTTGGAVWRVVSEALFFRTLFRSNKLTWIGGYIFHISFFAIIIQHTLRHYVYDFYNAHPPAWYDALIPIGMVFGVLMLVSLLYLLARRIFVDRIKLISLFSDYFILILLALIAIAGLAQVAFQPASQLASDTAKLDTFFNQLTVFQAADIPTNPFFLFHYSLVLFLIGYIPFSKIMHFVGIFFSPTFAMVDNPREKRYADERATRLTI